MIKERAEDRFARFFLGNEAGILAALGENRGSIRYAPDGLSALAHYRHFVYLAGKPNRDFFLAAAKQLPEDGFLSFAGEGELLEIAALMGADQEAKRQKMMLPAAWNLEKLKQLTKSPAGFSIRRLSEAERLSLGKEGWSEDLAYPFPKPDEALYAGLTVGAFLQGRPAGGCGVYAYSRHSVEIEIDIRPDCQGLGLGTACGAAFLLGCLERGITPCWDAMNPASAAVAMHLGFLPGEIYPVRCRNMEEA